MLSLLLQASSPALFSKNSFRTHLKWWSNGHGLSGCDHLKHICWASCFKQAAQHYVSKKIYNQNPFLLWSKSTSFGMVIKVALAWVAVIILWNLHKACCFTKAPWCYVSQKSLVKFIFWSGDQMTTSWAIVISLGNIYWASWIQQAAQYRSDWILL